MAKRFSRLKWASQAELTGTALTQYQGFRAGTRKANYTRAAGSVPGELAIVYLNPFGTDSTTIYEARGSQRALTNMADYINEPGLFNHEGVPADLGEVIQSRTFQPAKAVITQAGTGYSTDTSQITGLSYKKRQGTSTITVPFGAKGTANETSKYFAVCQNIQASVEAKNRRYGVTFKPEFF